MMADFSVLVDKPGRMDIVAGLRSLAIFCQIHILLCDSVDLMTY